MSDREAPVISIGSSREELEKRAGASLLAGDAVITFDNCNSALGGDLVCQMLSQRWVRVRVLGLSRQVDAPTSSLITATGNNLTLEGDMTRRSVCAELDAGVERPELREFDVNPKDVAIAEASGGAYHAFDQGSAKQLGELLRAVAAFAVGGVVALEKQGTAAARLLLGQVR